jgi:NitT/TauT family transport system substrate-binding protein
MISSLKALFRRAAVAGVALAVLISTSAAPSYAQSTDTAHKLIPINIGLPITNYWPAYVAREKKLFEQVGLEPHFYSFQTGAPLIAGMKSGSLDVAWTGLATLFMLGQDIPLTFILVPLDSSSQMAFVVNQSSGITSYKDLAKSKNIGAPTATCSQVSEVLAAKAAGVPSSSLHTSNLAPNLLQTALQSGQIDSAFIWGPWNFELSKAGYKIVAWDKDFEINGGVCATTIAVRPAFLAANPSVGCRLIKAHALSLVAARKEPELAIHTMEEAFNIPHDMAKMTYDTLLIPSIKSQLDANSPWSMTNKNGGLTEKLFVAGQALYEAKAFDKQLTKAQIAASVDPQYIKQFLDTDCDNFK